MYPKVQAIGISHPWYGLSMGTDRARLISFAVKYKKASHRACCQEICPPMHICTGRWGRVPTPVRIGTWGNPPPPNRRPNSADLADLLGF